MSSTPLGPLLVGLLASISAAAQQYTVVDLGTLSLTNSIPGGINSPGTVVGNGYAGHKSHAFIYSQGQQRDLYDAVDERTKALGGGLADAWAINDSGEVLNAHGRDPLRGPEPRRVTDPFT